MFDSKIFNGEVFGKYVERVPDLKRNELLKAGVLRARPDLGTMLDEQTGGNYIKVPMKGLLDGEVLNIAHKIEEKLGYKDLIKEEYDV